MGRCASATDYCLVPRAALESFAGLVVDFWAEHFAADGGAASSCGIITDRHVDRLVRPGGRRPGSVAPR